MPKIEIGQGEFLEVSAEKLQNALKDMFPAGDPLFQAITWEEQDLYNRKNTDYAGGGEDPNGNFFRAAAIWALYPGLKLSDPRVYAMSQMMKQLDQILWSLSRGYEGSVEGLESRLADVHVYAKIIRVLDRRMAELMAKGGVDSGDSDEKEQIVIHIPEMSQVSQDQTATILEEEYQQNRTEEAHGIGNESR